MMLDAPTLPTSVLAFVTTIHATLVVLRKHRSASGLATFTVVPSLALAASPWVFPTALGVVAGFGAHIAWYLACEWLFPAAVPSTGPAAALARVPAATHAPSPGTAAAAPRAPTRDAFVAVPVLAVLDETPTIRTFRLRRPEGFAFAAGQFLTVRVFVDGKAHVRCYSISSAPEATGYLEISVKRIGLVSATLHSTIRAGSTLMVRPPAGKFVYPAQDDRPIVLVAGGVGITPLMSMLRHGVSTDPGRPITLLYSVRSEEELAFSEELRWMIGRHPSVRLGVTLTGDCGWNWAGRRGRIDPAFIRDFVAEAAHAVFLLCGPQEMIAATRAMLSALGVPAAQIRSEVFQAAAAIGAKAAESPAGRAVGARAARAATRQMVLNRCHRSIPVGGEQTLLEAAESAGVRMESLCRSGVCGTCRTRLLEGEVQCTSDALDDRDRSDGWILPCVSWARSDVTLDA